MSDVVQADSKRFNSIRHVAIAKLAAVGGFLLLVLIFGAAAASYYNARLTEVGGTNHRLTLDSKDFLAAILPPPLYVTDAFLEMHVLEGDLH